MLDEHSASDYTTNFEANTPLNLADWFADELQEANADAHSVGYGKMLVLAG